MPSEQFLYDVPDIAVETLAQFIEKNICELTVRREWPYANQQLKYPSLTISTGNPKRTPLMPEQIAITAPDFQNKVVATEIVAEWDDTFQLDLWTRTKEERAIYTNKLIALFNSQEMGEDIQGIDQPDGLSLPLVNYFGEIARYDLDTFKCVDDEQAAERQERREKITVLINCREIRQRTYYAMVTIQAGVNTAKSEPVFEDDSENEEVTIT